ncbi:MAG: YtxH domain-containing protein [Wolinella sp.]
MADNNVNMGFENFSSLRENPYINQNGYQNYGNQGFGYNQAQNQGFFANSANSSNQSSWLNSNGWENGDFLKGALIGAAVTFLLTNETAQKSIFKAFAKATSMMQMGIEELKERYEDVKAELEAQESE